jgi:hypothetical protein
MAADVRVARVDTWHLGVVRRLDARPIWIREAGGSDLERVPSVEAIPFVVLRTADWVPQVRAAAEAVLCRCLEKRGPKDLLPSLELLRLALADRVGFVRRAAAESVAPDELPETELTHLLLDFNRAAPRLAQREWQRRGGRSSAAFYRHGCIRKLAAADAMVATLAAVGVPSHKVLDAAAEILVRRPSPDVQRAAERLVFDEEPSRRRVGLRLLEAGDPVWQADLLDVSLQRLSFGRRHLSHRFAGYVRPG